MRDELERERKGTQGERVRSRGDQGSSGATVERSVLEQ